MSKTLNGYGLSPRDMKTLFDVFKKYPEVDTLYIFGSRARGTHKLGSDIDLAVMKSNVTPEIMGQLRYELEESSLPYFVDLIDFMSIREESLVQHILQEGEAFYKSSLFK